MAGIATDTRSSRRRLSRLVIGTALIVCAIVGANTLILEQLHRTTLAEAQHNLLCQSLDLSELTEHTLQASDLVLSSIVDRANALTSADGSTEPLRSEDFHDFIKEKMSGMPQLHTLAIFDAGGNRVTFSEAWPAAQLNVAFREYFIKLKADPKLKFYLDAPLRGAKTGTWVMVLARPVRTKTGQFVGVAMASIGMDYFQETFQATSLGDGYAAALLRSDGVLLSRYPMAGQVGEAVNGSVMAKLGDSRSGVSRSISPVDHEARIVAAYRLSNFPLMIVVTQSEEAAFAAWQKTFFTMGFTTLAMVVVMIIAMGLMARSWRQQDRLNAARADVIEAEKDRALAEVELQRQHDLAEQSMRFNAAVEGMTQGLCMFDQDRRLVVCNTLYTRMYQLPPHLMKPGSLHTDIIADRVRRGILKGDRDQAAVDRHYTVLKALPPTERSIRIDEHSDGRLIRVTREPLPCGGWVATHDDITEQHRAEQELDETKRFLDSIIENIPVAVVVKDAVTRKYVLVNRAFEAMLDLPREELLDHTVFEIFKASEATFIHKADDESIHNGDGVHSLEYELETPRRGVRIQETNRIVLRDARGEPRYLISVIDDVTERRRAEQRVAFLAHHDALTGLANRAALTQKIDDAAARQRRRGEPFSVLLLDLDRFKQVNDTLGHPAGDTLLTEVAARLKALLRETDGLARLGGDEFAIIQTGETNQREAAQLMANRIIEVLGKPFGVEGTEVTIGTSIGIALAPEHDTGASNLLKMADLALYRAKSTGRNAACFFDPEMSEVASIRQETENDLRRAVQQGHLELHYQPIIDTKTRKICSVEALVRWRHPTKGLIYPDLFIPLAEETGLITQIGEWVLQTACAEAATWPSEIKVAVNLSLVQFHKTNLPEVVTRALDRSGLSPQRLELEITETALIESAAECLPALRQFKSLGITIVLDDFGTGYSSLSQLAMFPFDRIKIDKTFTQNLTKRSECAAIISATLTLAQNLDIATTAEGVETADQYRLLRLAGVTSLQGYLFQRPVPAREIDFDGIYGGPELEHAA